MGRIARSYNFLLLMCQESKELTKLRYMTVPDIHCRHEYVMLAEEKLKKGNCDKLIFLGDYCDSFDRSNLDMMHTLNQVVRIKKENPEKVELLLGNHDLPYTDKLLYGACSGFRPEAFSEVNQLFRDNKRLFNVAYQVDKHLFTHAGVCNRWLHKHKQTLDRWSQVGDSLADTLNRIRFTRDIHTLYTVGRARGGMRGEVGSPLWADMVESIVDALLGYHQYVGHTPIKAVRTETLNDDTNITYLDVLPHDIEFKVFEIETEVGKEGNELRGEGNNSEVTV